MTERDDEQLWSVVADPSRRRVIDAMLLSGETTQTELAAQLPFTRQAVAKHLAVLEQVALVTRRKVGRDVLFRLDLDRLELAARAMSRIAARWDQRLTKIKKMAELAHKSARAQSKEKVR
jgi:DNA-binding transcriptional ArsR family regulator